MTFTLIAKKFKLIYMLSKLYVRVRMKAKVGILESFKVGTKGWDRLALKEKQDVDVVTAALTSVRNALQKL